MRPTGPLHLGHLTGALDNWRRLQDEYECFYCIVDWHALTTDYADTSGIRENVIEVAVDWLAAGLDPERSTLFIQSLVPQHAELHLLLSMIVPVPWLERVPSYKEQQQQLQNRDLSTYGFLGYPLLQSADIIVYRADAVPVGEDQAPHVELTREVVRRFNHFYGPVFPEPKTLLTETPRTPGTDGRKMSKSYGNAIYISDTPDEIRAKVMSMLTDPARKLKTDPGDPDICPLHSIHKLIAPEGEIAEWDACCRSAECGCVAHKKKLIDDLTAYLAPFRERRAELAARPGYAWEVLAAGAERARPVTREVIDTVRGLTHIDPLK
jgi:tryptophanyl-tRNA synthetase